MAVSIQGSASFPSLVCDVAVRSDTGESVRGAPARELELEDVDNDVLELVVAATRFDRPALPSGVVFFPADEGGGFFMFVLMNSRCLKE